MKKTGIFKKVCAVLLSLSIAAGNCAANVAYAANDNSDAAYDLFHRDEECVYEGQCGENVFFEYDPSTYSLVVHGEGRMWDYEEYRDAAPWGKYRRQIKQVTIEPGVTKIGSYAFAHLSSLYTVNIPDTVESIAGNAFGSCTGLRSATISAAEIESQAFHGCTMLSGLRLENTRLIGYAAFNGCEQLTHVELPDTLETFRDAFYKCTGLKTIGVSADNSYFTCEDGILYNKDMTELILCPIAYEFSELDVPGSVDSLSSYAFKDNKKLKEIRFDNDDIYISSYSFNGSYYNEHWTELDTENKYTDEDGNVYLIVCGKLLGMTKNDPESDMVLDLTKAYENEYNSTVIDAIYIDSGKYPYIANIISDHYVPMEKNFAQSTSWYDRNGSNIIYDTEDPADSSYSYFYNYTGDETSVDITGISAIGKYAFDKYTGRLDQPLTIYMSSDVQYIDPYAFGSSDIEYIYVDGERVDIDYLAQLKDEWIKVEGGNHAISEEHQDDFLYRFSLAAASASSFFDKISAEKWEKVLYDELHIENYKTDAQKVKVIFEWMKANFSYSFQLTNDKAISNSSSWVKIDGYNEIASMTYGKAGLWVTGHGVCAAYAQMVEQVMNIAGIPVLYISNSDAHHALNLVQAFSDEIDPDNNIWYYLDAANSIFFFLDTSVFFSGVDFLEDETGYINEKGYSGSFADAPFEGIETMEIEIRSALTKDVEFSCDDPVYFGVQEYTPGDVKYVAFSEKSYFHDFNISVDDEVLFTIEDPLALEPFSGTYKLSDTTISYDIKYEHTRDVWGTNYYTMYFDIWDSDSVYVSMNDMADVVSYYTVSDAKDPSAKVMKYTESALVPGYSDPCIRFYDENDNEIFMLDEYRTTQVSGDVKDFDIAYRAYSGMDNGKKAMVVDICKKGDVTMNGIVDRKGSNSIIRQIIHYYKPITTGSLGDLTISGDNITINGDVAANGTFKLEGKEAYVNGQLSASKFVNSMTGVLDATNDPIGGKMPADGHVQAVYDDEKITNIFFNEESVKSWEGDYTIGSSDINAVENLSVSGKIDLSGNASVNANLKAESDISIIGNDKIAVNGVIYSKDGSITINADNVDINGLIYAPNGTVTIKGDNVNIQGAMVADKLVVEGSSVIFNAAAVNESFDRTEGTGELTLGDFQLLIGDMNYDGIINIADVVLINKRIQPTTPAPLPKPGGGKAPNSEYKLILGDVNGDGIVDVSDISILAAYKKGLGSIDPDKLVNADADGDGYVTVGDVTAVAGYVKGVVSLN